MFWTPAWSETFTIVDVAKLTRFCWWRLTAGPDEANLFGWTTLSSVSSEHAHYSTLQSYIYPCLKIESA